MADIVVTDNSEASRYEAHIDGELAGITAYHLTRASIVFTHSEVEDKFEGHGVGSTITRFALDDVRKKGERDVVPLCPFVHDWIDKHPEYADLVRRHGEDDAL